MNSDREPEKPADPAPGPGPRGAPPAASGVRSEATGLIAPADAGPPAERQRTGPGDAGAGVARAAELALLAFAAAVPVSLAAGQILLGLAAVLWIAAERLRGLGHRYPRWLLIGLGLLFGGEWLACLVNGALSHLGDPWRKHGVLLALPVLAAVARRDPLLYRRAVSVAVAMAAIVASYAVWQHFAGVDLVRDRVLEARGDVFMATGTFSHHLAYGGSTMLALLAAAGLTAGGTRWRGLPAALLVPIGFGLLWCYARSSWTGAFAGLLALAVARRGRRPLLLVAVGVGAFALLVLGDPSVRARMREGLAAPTGLVRREPPPRLLLAATSLRMLADHPLGIAPGRFSELFPIYRVPGRYMATMHAHSDPMRAALDGGPLGLAGYLVLVAGSLIGAARALPRRPAPPESGDPDRMPAAARRDLLLIALAVSAAYLVAGLFQTYFWDQEVVMLWVLLAAPAMAVAGGAAGAPERRPARGARSGAANG